MTKSKSTTKDTPVPSPTIGAKVIPISSSMIFAEGKLERSDTTYKSVWSLFRSIEVPLHWSRYTPYPRVQSDPDYTSILKFSDRIRRRYSTLFIVREVGKEKGKVHFHCLGVLKNSECKVHLKEHQCWGEQVVRDSKEPLSPNPAEYGDPTYALYEDTYQCANAKYLSDLEHYIKYHGRTFKSKKTSIISYMLKDII